jgi:hypothetical protein
VKIVRLAILTIVLMVVFVGQTPKIVLGANVTVAPAFAASYTAIDLGAVPGLGASGTGGIAFKPGDPNTMLIMGRTDTNAALFSFGVLRDNNNHITGYAGNAVVVAPAPHADGGMGYVDDVLLYARYITNQLGEIKDGSTATDKVVNLTALGADPGVAGVGVVPMGYPGTGKLKSTSYVTGSWSTDAFSLNGSGTLDITSVTKETTLTGGPEGFAFVPAGSPIFPANSMIQAEFDTGVLSTYSLDSDGDPLPGTRQVVASGFAIPAGVAIDPITGDALISHNPSSPHLEVVRGFAGPPQTATPRIWGDVDCGGDIGPRDAQAILKNVLVQNPLSQTQPCPAVGAQVTVDGVSRIWGDVDCGGDIGPRDAQAILKNVLVQNALSQTQPCPPVGSTVQVVG